MKTKIEKMKLKRAGKHKIVEVTLKKGGKEHVFTAKALHVLDDATFKDLLQIWDEKMIPEREAEEALTDEAIEVGLENIKKGRVK